MDRSRRPSDAQPGLWAGLSSCVRALRCRRRRRRRRRRGVAGAVRVKKVEVEATRGEESPPRRRPPTPPSKTAAGARARTPAPLRSSPPQSALVAGVGNGAEPKLGVASRSAAQFASSNGDMGKKIPSEEAEPQVEAEPGLMKMSNAGGWLNMGAEESKLAILVAHLMNGNFVTIISAVSHKKQWKGVIRIAILSISKMEKRRQTRHKVKTTTRKKALVVHLTSRSKATQARSFSFLASPRLASAHLPSHSIPLPLLRISLSACARRFLRALTTRFGGRSEMGQCH
uniref:Uncharacterized protein n=1 Tax=Oryza meridionalis TaxID=40149 RepID=A0A0E0DRW1_9ORYZ